MVWFLGCEHWHLSHEFFSKSTLLTHGFILGRSCSMTVEKVFFQVGAEVNHGGPGESEEFYKEYLYLLYEWRSLHLIKISSDPSLDRQGVPCPWHQELDPGQIRAQVSSESKSREGLLQCYKVIHFLNKGFINIETYVVENYMPKSVK